MDIKRNPQTALDNSRTILETVKLQVVRSTIKKHASKNVVGFRF
jgi:hypothetical protein